MQDDHTQYRVAYEEESGSNNSWIMVFSDLLALLIAFFVLMYAMRDVGDTKWKQLKSIETVFNPKYLVESKAKSLNATITAKPEISSFSPEYLASVLERKIAKQAANIITAPNILIISISKDDIFIAGSKLKLSRDANLLLFNIAEAISSTTADIAVYTNFDKSQNKVENFSSPWHLALTSSRILADELRKHSYIDNIVAAARTSYDEQIFTKAKKNDKTFTESGYVNIVITNPTY